MPLQGWPTAIPLQYSRSLFGSLHNPLARLPQYRLGLFGCLVGLLARLAEAQLVRIFWLAGNGRFGHPRGARLGPASRAPSRWSAHPLSAVVADPARPPLHLTGSEPCSSPLRRRIVPPHVAAGLPRLQFLELYYNELEGGVLAELGNLTELTDIDLSENRLTGGIPESLCALRNLRVL